MWQGAMTRIGVIEDDTDTRDAVRFLFTDAGYEVVEARDGLEGRLLLESSQERMIVLLDYRLPALDGCDLLEIVAQDEQLRARHTFIMMSASPRQAAEDCEEAVEELDVPVVPKPFHIDELLDAVRQAEQRLEPELPPAIG